MTIDELKIEKRETENRIAAFVQQELNAFAKKTGVGVGGRAKDKVETAQLPLL